MEQVNMHPAEFIVLSCYYFGLISISSLWEKSALEIGLETLKRPLNMRSVMVCTYKLETLSINKQHTVALAPDPRAGVTAQIPAKRGLSLCLLQKALKAIIYAAFLLSYRTNELLRIKWGKQQRLLKLGRKRPLLRSHFQLRRRGTKQSSSPLHCSFSLVWVWMFAVICPLVSQADNRLREISLSTFSIQDDREVT